MTDLFEEQYKNMGFDAQRRYPNENLIGFVAKNFFSAPQRSSIKILEIGCGSGAQLWFLAREGFDVYGMDNSPTGLEYCKKMLEQYSVTARLKLGDMRKLEYEDALFDAVVDVVSLQHILYKDHETVCKEVFRCLKPGGKFFSYHLGENSVSYLHGGGKLIDENTIDKIKDPSKPLYNNGPICFISADKMRDIMEQAGFINIVIDRVQRTYNNQACSMEYLVISAEKPKE